jgi:outer membrane protein assembly factor BamD
MNISSIFAHLTARIIDSQVNASLDCENMKFLRLLGILTLTFQVLAGCSSGEKFDLSTPEGAFKQAESFEKDERYEEAITKFSDVKNRFPYSKLALQAELQIADIHYKREAFIEAQNAYQLFKEFHPKHPQSDYVTFRLAMSYFNQLPSTVDRDISVSDKAILYFDELVSTYPKSQYVAEANKHKTEALVMQAQQELYVANFYMRRQQYDSALRRFETVIKTYPGLGLDAEALLGAVQSAMRSGEKEVAVGHFKNLIAKFPQSDEAKRAKNELK